MLTYLQIQLKRIPIYIKASYLNLIEWGNWHEKFEINYLRFYRVIYKIIIPAGFIIGLIYSFWNKNSINFITSILILYFVFISVFFHYKIQY